MLVLVTIKTERERQRDKETERDATPPPPTFDQLLPAHTISGRYITIANLKKKKKAYRPTPGSRKFVIQHTTANSRGRMGNMMASSIESSSSTSGTSSVSQDRRLSTY